MSARLPIPSRTGTSPTWSAAKPSPPAPLYTSANAPHQQMSSSTSTFAASNAYPPSSSPYSPSSSSPSSPSSTSSPSSPSSPPASSSSFGSSTFISTTSTPTSTYASVPFVPPSVISSRPQGGVFSPAAPSSFASSFAPSAASVRMPISSNRSFANASSPSLSMRAPVASNQPVPWNSSQFASNSGANGFAVPAVRTWRKTRTFQNPLGQPQQDYPIGQTSASVVPQSQSQSHISPISSQSTLTRTGGGRGWVATLGSARRNSTADDSSLSGIQTSSPSPSPSPSSSPSSSAFNEAFHSRPHVPSSSLSKQADLPQSPQPEQETESLDEGLAHLDDFISEVLNNRAVSQNKSATFGLGTATSALSFSKKVPISDSNPQPNQEEIKALQDKVDSLSTQLEASKKKNKELMQQMDELITLEHKFLDQKTTDITPSAKSQPSTISIEATTPQISSNANAEEIKLLQETVAQLIQQINLRDEDLKRALTALQDFEKQNFALNQKIHSLEVQGTQNIGSKPQQAKIDISSIPDFPGKEETILTIHKEVEEFFKKEMASWKRSFIEDTEKRVAQEKIDLVEKLQSSLSEEKGSDMISYLQEQEKRRQEYEQRLLDEHPERKEGMALPEQLEKTESIVYDPLKVAEENKIRVRFPTIESIEADLVLTGRIEHDADELLASVTASVKALMTHFSSAPSLAAKLELGSDKNCKNLAGLVRGGLATSLVKVFLHRFKTERTETGKFHIWDAVVTATKENSSREDFTKFCEAVKFCNSYTTDKHKAFRTFICYALNSHLLHVWVYVVSSCANVCTTYYKPGAMVTEPEPLALLVNTLRPLHNGSLPFSLSLDYEDSY
eukprot:TRINITY_DN152_c2_g1_i1.p1 TRINITY_DN152_c2_g1~~TRINITY_DN152_c2_g1_i1.p1  ORF type:complete len:846 (+),score=251.41 TRINITY_DN152_c2_g1_i1:22-2559(+)